MTDRKPRINVTVDDDMNELLTALSKFEGKPKATHNRHTRTDASAFD